MSTDWDEQAVGALALGLIDAAREVGDMLPEDRAVELARFWLAAHDAQVWDEGHADGLWNAEHQVLIEVGIRDRIVNPYRVPDGSVGPASG